MLSHDRNDFLEMTPEQERMYSELTPLQKEFCKYSLTGMNNTDAYIAAGGKAKTEVSQRRAANQLLTYCNKYLESVKKNTINKIIQEVVCTSEDIARRLVLESQLFNKEPVTDHNQSGRVKSLQLLSNYTGGFDKNTNKIEGNVYIEKHPDELYDDE